jgi:hypothetical protein
VLLFAALIFHTETKIPERSKSGEITEPSCAASTLWETRNCIGCHTLLGEGAYFAPELGNVYERRGPDFIKGWIKAMPTNTPGRRQMPQFNFTDAQLTIWSSSCAGPTASTPRSGHPTSKGKRLRLHAMSHPPFRIILCNPQPLNTSRRRSPSCTSLRHWACSPARSSSV